MPTNTVFWNCTGDTDRDIRMALHFARFMSWKLGRRVLAPNPTQETHWVHKPLEYADTHEWVTS